MTHLDWRMSPARDWPGCMGGRRHRLWLHVMSVTPIPNPSPNPNPKSSDVIKCLKTHSSVILPCVKSFALHITAPPKRHKRHNDLRSIKQKNVIFFISMCSDSRFMRLQLTFAPGAFLPSAETRNIDAQSRSRRVF